jgi:hypothetical protein
MRIVHTRTKRVHYVDDVKYYKAVVIKISLDRYKEWELEVEDFKIKAFNNKLGIAIKEVKDKLRQLHKDYLDDTLEEEIRDVYKDYVKPFFWRSQISQKEFRASMKGFNKKRLENENKSE